MKHSKLYIGDYRVDVAEDNPEGALAGRLLAGCNYVYARINTMRHKPLYLARHLDIACSSFEKLYGVRPEPKPADISLRIERLLYENRMPQTGNVVTLYITGRSDMLRGKAGTSREPEIIITAGEASIYSGYVVESVRPRAIVTNYEIPLAGHRTAISLTAARYMENYAVRNGAAVALRAGRAGNLLSAGDYPVFAVKSGTVITPEPVQGAGPSVEYELMLEACRRAGITVERRNIPLEQLTETDELMVFGPEGIVSLLNCGEIYFYNIVALELEKQLPKITEEGLESV